MSNNLMVTGEILPACDLCYSRKVKYNRQAPCANCADAGVECRRLRHGRSSKKRALESDYVPKENIASFKVHPPGAQRPCSNPGTTASRNSLTSESSSTTRQPGYHDTDSAVRSPTPGAMSASSNDGSNYHATQAKSVIQIDLHNPRHISRERQSLLKSALQLVSSIADSEPRHNATSVTEESRPLVSDHIIPQRPSRELLYMLLPGPPESVRIQWPDHISDKTFARMATTLLRDDADIEDQTFRQYYVCVYVKAIFHLYQASRRTDDPILKDELARSRSIYVAAAMRSTEHFNILKAPDITTIQFLISSAFLMQHLGKPSQCWLFISYAARQITALNYHRIRKPPAASDSEQEIYDAVYWCYYLDRTLSSLLCRPPSLRSEPGGLLPRHRHVESAEIFVLKGSGAHPQTGAFVEGVYVSESKGAVHDPLPFECETELLLVARGPSVFLADDGSDMFTMDVAMLQDMVRAAQSV